MFRAAIFDMDGLLIDSEPYWKVAEREVFGSVGIEISDTMSELTAVMTPRAVTEHWYRTRPWVDRSLDEMENAVIERVAELVVTQGAALPGVREILALCREMGWRLGLASNSPARLCRIVLAELELTAHFEVIVSADDVEQGKPEPAIYLAAALALGVKPAECLAFEDSSVGVRAARAAGMMVVAVPSRGQVFQAPHALPHVELRALHEFDREHAHRLWALRTN